MTVRDIDFKNLREKDIASAFQRSPRQIQNWVKDGCPRHADGFNLFEVHTWLLSREIEKSMPAEAESLKDKKTQEEINVLRKRQEKMDFEMQQLLDTTVPKDKYERDKMAIIESFTGYLRTSVQRNMATLRSVPEADADVVLNKFIMELTAQMSRAGNGE